MKAYRGRCWIFFGLTRIEVDDEMRARAMAVVTAPHEKSIKSDPEGWVDAILRAACNDPKEKPHV